MHILRHPLVALLMLSVVGGPGSLAAQTSDDSLQGLRKDIDALKEGQKQLQRELQELRTLLRSRGAAPDEPPQNLVLSLDDAPIKGEQTARLVLIDFSDYQ